MAWKTLKRWMHHLESRGEMLRISRPVDVEYEAGAIADLLVKNDGPAVLFEQPRLADGSISKIPLVMNIFGSNDRTLRALGASHETEVGDRMVAMMKPNVGFHHSHHSVANYGLVRCSKRPQGSVITAKDVHHKWDFGN